MFSLIIDSYQILLLWFMQNLWDCRLCEICGEAATNISGVGDSGFMEEWSEGRRGGDEGDVSVSYGGGRCLQGQPLCNILMACLVLAFILPWFFPGNLF